MVDKIVVSSSDDNMRLDRWIKMHFPHIPYPLLQKFLRTGQIRINGKRAKSGTILHVQEEVRIPPLTTPDHKKTVRLPSKQDLDWFDSLILYEDTELIVINKPHNVAVQGGTNTEFHLDLIVHHHPHYPGLRLTHRIDKDTSGLLVIAKSYDSARWLTGAFKEKSIQKNYLAVVVGKPTPSKGIIDLPLEKIPGKSEKMSAAAEGKPSITHYETLEISRNLSLVSLQPETGRTHQLRVHCMAKGFPILGDGKYAGKQAHPLEKRSLLHLHAYEMIVPYPQGENKHFQAPLPLHMQLTLHSEGFKSVF